ncbi:MAG: sulfatase family protein [Opitutaceae bacterium]
MLSIFSKQLALASIILCAAATGLLAKPNIIVIMADDLGYGDLGYTGSKNIPTPNIDRLANEGVECTYGYVTHPYCGPSRAGFLTGRYQQRFGFETNPPYSRDNTITGMPQDETLFAERLQAVGYKTGVVGKWHIGSHGSHHPNNRGFDFFFGFLGGGHDFFRVDLTEPLGEGYLDTLMRNGKPVDVEGYLTRQLTDEAIGFVERNQDDPFFLFVSYNAPHAPLQAPKESVAKFSHLDGWELQTYSAMVYEMDLEIGRLLNTLESTDLSEDTLIFFLSDNGGPPHWDKSQDAYTSNGTFRGYKGDTYDGGVHVPFLAYWPGTLPAGKTFTKPVVSLDIASTAVSLAGGATSGLEGVDLMPYLKGQDMSAPHKAIYFRRRNSTAWGVVTADGYKWIKNDWDQQSELYNLFSDTAEQNDIIEQEPERAATLKKIWQEWNEQNIPHHFSDIAPFHRDVKQFYKTMKPE